MMGSPAAMASRTMAPSKAWMGLAPRVSAATWLAFWATLSAPSAAGVAAAPSVMKLGLSASRGQACQPIMAGVIRVPMGRSCLATRT